METPDLKRSARRPPRRKVRSAGASPREAAESIRIHDLKNLACRLSALLQNLSDHYHDPLFKDSAMEVLRDTVERMNQMVSQYRRSPGQVIVKLALNVNDLLAGISPALPLDRFPRVRIREEYGKVPLIWGDDYYLRNALVSIIENALESMPAGGTLSLRTRTLWSEGRPRVVVEIEDTGVGMRRSFVRNQLFSPFATTKPDGLGLGLYNARQAIDLHDGTIQVHSVPSRGTVFRLLFEAAEEDVS